MKIGSEIVWHRGHFYVVADGVKIAKRGHPNFSRKLPFAAQVELGKMWIPIEPGYEVFEDDYANVTVYRSDNGRAVQ
jgi:hypothetical protein